MMKDTMGKLDPTTITRKVIEMDKLYAQCLEELDALRTLTERMERSNKHMEDLLEFYQTDWMEYQEALEGTEHYAYPVMGEDGIYDLIVERRQTLIAMMKQCIAAIE